MLAKRRERLTGEAESGIIKAITIKDIQNSDTGEVISDECKKTIFNTLKAQGAAYIYDEVKVVKIPRDKEGRMELLRTNAISSPGYPKVILEINEEAFGGKTKAYMDKLIKLQKYSTANSLEEAVIHECAHAKVINGKFYSQYKAIDEELSGPFFTQPIKGRADKKSLKDLAGEISEYAQKDGLECIAESHVKLSRKEYIPEELKILHDQYIE